MNEDFNTKKRNWYDVLIKRQEDRESKREKAIKNTGVDPKTGLTVRRMVLTDKTRTRGGKNSRRRTARVWEPVPTDSD